MTAQYQLVGFNADLAGARWQMVEAAPVVIRDPRAVHVARGLDWDNERLVEASVGDDAFLSFVTVKSQLTIDEGDTVWIVGGPFAEAVRRCHFTTTYGFELGGWETLGNGFRWSSGPRQQFREWISGLASRLELGIHNSLFDGLEMTVGSAEEMFRIYSGLPVADSRSRALTRGLYFDQTHDRRSYEFVRTQSVRISQLFDTPSAFDSGIRELKAWLAEERLSTTARPRVPGADNSRASTQPQEAHYWFSAQPNWESVLKAIRKQSGQALFQLEAEDAETTWKGRV